jgi:hypothetical protein
MNDTRGLEALHRIAERESRSLPQYMLGVYPWTTATCSEALDRLQGMIEAERGALVALTRYLYRHKVPPPHSGGYPADYTSLNFTDLNYLAGVLARSHEDDVARIKDDLGMVHDEEGKRLGQALLDLKVKHLDALRHLNAPEPAVTP